jgi:hypothetical protein
MSDLARNRRNDLMKSVYFLRAKTRCKARLSCFLDELPSELVPRRRLSAPAIDGALVVSESFRYQPGGDLPDELRGHALPLDGFLRGYPIAWVQDPGTDLWTPFWVRGEWIELLRSLEPGLPAPSVLRPDARQTLAMAGALVPPGFEAARRSRWERTCRSARTQFREEGFTVVRDVIHPLQLGAMRRYYRALVADGRLLVGDNQVAERYRVHSELVASFVHPQLASLVGRIAGEPVKPSYVYFACYPPGSALPRHQDREQCEFSISLLVDYIPDPDGPCGWPLLMENPSAPDVAIAADLGVGDAVFYRGRQLVHYRDRLPDGHVSTSLFFHYVRDDYGGDLF